MAHTLEFNLSDSLKTTSGYSLPLLARLAVRFAVVVTKWDVKQRTRKQLKNLDDHMLRDIGLERGVALTEATRPFWQ